MNKLLILVSILSIILFIIVKLKLKHKNINNPFRSVWNRDSKTEFGNLISHFHKFCQDRKLAYSLFYGSLLGHQRHHKKLIPWDDDADCCVSDKIHESYTKLETDKIGITEYKNYYKIYLKKNPQIKNYPWSWPFLDIFPIHMINQKNMIIPPFPKITLSISDVFPTKLSTIENNPVMIPAKPEKLLTIWYGPKWRSVCMSGSWRHRTESPIQNHTKLCKDV